MNKRLNRKAIVLSAISTTVVLMGIGAAMLLATPPATDATTTPVDAQPVVIDRAQALTPAQTEAEIAADRAQLAEAYQALERAYAQIDTLQANQARLTESRSWGEREHESEHHDHIIFEYEHEDDRD